MEEKNHWCLQAKKLHEKINGEEKQKKLQLFNYQQRQAKLLSMFTKNIYILNVQTAYLCALIKE